MRRAASHIRSRCRMSCADCQGTDCVAREYLMAVRFQLVIDCRDPEPPASRCRGRAPSQARSLIRSRAERRRARPLRNRHARSRGQRVRHQLSPDGVRADQPATPGLRSARSPQDSALRRACQRRCSGVTDVLAWPSLLGSSAGAGRAPVSARPAEATTTPAPLHIRMSINPTSMLRLCALGSQGKASPSGDASPTGRPGGVGGSYWG